MGTAHDYATAILHRGRVPMDPVDFVPDWADGPRKAKHYPAAGLHPLPTGQGYPADGTVDRGLAPGPPAAPAAFDLPTLADMLRDSYGVTGRRLGVQANTDLSALPHYPLANWSRGTASGGGLYPVSIYWVAGPSSPTLPGVSYYSPRHHGLRHLLTGDVTGDVRAALDDTAPGPVATDHFLVLGVKYWQNAFKYNSFSFHAVSMDLGALLATWRMWAAARGLEIDPVLWFDEARLARLLGVSEQEEGIFAVVPLRWARQDPAPAAGSAPDTGAAPAGPARPGGRPTGATVTHQDQERSRRVLSFPTLTAMQTATAENAARRPSPGALLPAAGPTPDPGTDDVTLPRPRQLDGDVRTALRARRSSFGRFAATRPLDAAELSTCLAAATAGARLGGDSTALGGDALPRLYALVNHVRGVEPATYAYQPGDAGARLSPITAGPPGRFLQRNYFLANYNLEQAGAVLVATVRTPAVLDAVGDRGYRLVNALIGGIAQATYTAAADLGLGCGVALGFDNISYIEELRLDATGEAPLLIMMVGHERPQPADYHYGLT